MNPDGRRSECWADRVVWDRIVVKITGLAVSRDVLAKQSVLALNRWNSAEYFHLLPTGENLPWEHRKD